MSYRVDPGSKGIITLSDIQTRTFSEKKKEGKKRDAGFDRSQREACWWAVGSPVGSRVVDAKAGFLHQGN
jgi:hypothetical protein